MTQARRRGKAFEKPILGQSLARHLLTIPRQAWTFSWDRASCPLGGRPEPRHERRTIMPKRFAVFALAPVVLAFGMAGNAASAKDWTTASIAFEGAYEPWNLTKPDGTIDGFEPELAKDICARAKIDCKFIAQDWDGMMAGLAAGKFDIIMDALSITPDRQKVIDFS